MDTQIDAQFAAIAADVLAWKLAGAALWQALGACAGAALLFAPAPSTLPARVSPSSLALSLARLLAAYATTLLVLCAQRRVLAARDVPPVRLPWPSSSSAAWAALAVARLGLRTRRAADVVAALGLYGAYALSGATCVLLLGGHPSGGGGGGDGGGGGGGGGGGTWSLLDGSGGGGGEGGGKGGGGSEGGGGEGGGGGGPAFSFFWWRLLYGSVLGLWFAAGHLLGCRNVVSYPTIDRLRWPRMRRRARAAARSALVGSAGAVALALALWQLLPPLSATAAVTAAATSAGVAPFDPGHHHSLRLRDVLSAWRAALACALAWLAGAHALDVVFGEPLQFAGGDARATAGDDAAAAALSAAAAAADGRGSLDAAAAASSPLVAPTALLAALRHRDPIVQDWAMRDLCRAAEAGGPRRRALFSDATGATGWAPASAACLAELRRACDTLSWAGGDGDGGGGDGKGKLAVGLMRASAAAAGAAGGPTPAADAGAWHLRAHAPRLSWAARALAALLAASLHEDAYGVALDSGSLAEGCLALLALEAALLARRRAVAAASGGGGGRGGGRGGGGGGGADASCFLLDSAAESLLDAVQGGLYRVAGAFGGALVPVVAQRAAAAAAEGDCAALPPPLSGGEAAARLQRYLD